MWPNPREPISRTRYAVVGVIRQTVSGTPTSELREPTLATVSPWRCSTDHSRSLVLVFPEDPVMPMTTAWALRSTRAWARATNAACTSWTTTDGRSATGREVSAATAPWDRAAPTNWWPSRSSPTRAMYKLPCVAARESVTTGPSTKGSAPCVSMALIAPNISPPVILAISLSLRAITALGHGWHQLRSGRQCSALRPARTLCSREMLHAPSMLLSLVSRRRTGGPRQQSPAHSRVPCRGPQRCRPNRPGRQPRGWLWRGHRSPGSDRLPTGWTVRGPALHPGQPPGWWLGPPSG